MSNDGQCLVMKLMEDSIGLEIVKHFHLIQMLERLCISTQTVVDQEASAKLWLRLQILQEWKVFTGILIDMLAI